MIKFLRPMHPGEFNYFKLNIAKVMNTNQNLKEKPTNGGGKVYLASQNPQTAQHLSNMNLFLGLLHSYKKHPICLSEKSESNSINQPSKLSLV